MLPDPLQTYAPTIPDVPLHGASALMPRIYQWMALGLGVTGGVALAVQRVPTAMAAIIGSPLVWLLLLGTVVMAVALRGFATRMSAPVAFAVLLAYAALMGVALAPVFWRYTAGSIGTTFLVTGAMFAAMSVFGRLTRRDLAGWGSFLTMGLVGVVLASAVNGLAFGFHSSRLDWLTTYVGVVAFTGLAAVDTQRIQQIARANAEATPLQMAIQGATILYLDFVNIFVLLLRFFGRDRD